MSMYTTGEIAKLCGVTVRTVQYYDSRNLLTPSELSEGGRRLYSEDDVRKLKIICFLRNLDLPISSIGELFQEENFSEVMNVLLEQQGATLRKEISERQEKLHILEKLAKELKSIETLSVESIGDIACKMETRRKLRKMRTTILAIGILVEIFEAAALILGILKGIWLPFGIWAAVELLVCFWLVQYYFKRVAYICPHCHKVFKPGYREFFFAKHTMELRKLTCTECGQKSFCIETYDEAIEEKV